MNFRIWYSTEPFADFIIANTELKNKIFVKKKMYESDANNAMKNSAVAKELFGATFVNHFGQTRDWEVRQFAKVVTDWETKRYFEII